jgi:hypothetical protein
MRVALVLLFLMASTQCPAQTSTEEQTRIAAKAVALGMLYEALFNLDRLPEKMEAFASKPELQMLRRAEADCFTAVQADALRNATRLAEIEEELRRRGIPKKSIIGELMMDQAGLARAARFLALGFGGGKALRADAEFQQFAAFAPITRNALPMALNGLGMTEEQLKSVFSGVYIPVIANVCPSL